MGGILRERTVRDPCACTVSMFNLVQQSGWLFTKPMGQGPSNGASSPRKFPRSAAGSSLGAAVSVPARAVAAAQCCARAAQGICNVGMCLLRQGHDPQSDSMFGSNRQSLCRMWRAGLLTRYVRCRVVQMRHSTQDQGLQNSTEADASRSLTKQPKCATGECCSLGKVL